MTIAPVSRSSADAPALQVQPASAFGAVRSLFAAHPAFRGQDAVEIVMTNHLHRERTERPKESPKVAPKTAAPKASLYEEITARIIADLEAGTFPWAQPWGASPGNAALGLPRNAATGKSYSGVNVLILWGRLFDRGFTRKAGSPFTKRSALEAQCARANTGSASVTPTSSFPRATEATARAAKPHQARATGTARARRCRSCGAISPLTSQCENLPDHCLGSAPALPGRQIVPQAEALARATLADIRTGGAHAFYQPSEDAVHIPPQPAFFDQINYYRSPFYELGHWTGHSSRLGRDLTGSFGSKAYANEELVAEITAAFVCAALSIQPTVRHADYLGNWLSVLRSDNRAIFRAASKASKAADFLLAVRKSEPAILPDGEATR